MRRPRQLPKVLMFQLHKCPACWSADLVPSNGYGEEQDQECEYIELVQRHVYMEPTPREDLEAEPKIPVATVPIELEIENAYEPIRGMEELE